MKQEIFTTDNLNIIVKMQFGSHLYGTSGPNSDIDYKGIYMPTRRQILLGQFPKSINHTTKSGNRKNGNEDIDTEIFSLHYFIKLACEGQTIALDMLHAPKDMIIETNGNTWQKLQSLKKQFYTKNLNAFIGYARKQAAKYGIKGSRLNSAKEIMDYLEKQLHDDKIREHWNNLPRPEHVYDIEKSPNGFRQLQVCGKIIQETVTCQYAFNMLHDFWQKYGKRAKEAAKNKNIDWKAVSHAMRAALQLKEILTTKDLIFPLTKASYLKDIKEGKLDYQTEVAPQLESLMDKIEILAKKSKFPEKVDTKYWENFIIGEIEKNVL